MLSGCRDLEKTSVSNGFLKQQSRYSMSEIITLRGMAWDHPRGYDPLRITSAAFVKKYPSVRIEWYIRSLKEFGDMPIEEMVDSYDLITIDHPHMGHVDSNQLLLPLEERLPERQLSELAAQSVGPSFNSYIYQDHLYALPIDAAALVAASRDDLVAMLNLELPRTRKELLNFYRQVPCNYAVAWPLCATDLWCTFLTLCAQQSGRTFIQQNTIDERTGIAVLDELKYHLHYIHPDSTNWNPIQLLDCMSCDDEIIYSPYLFGYTNYSRNGYSKKIVSFSNSPRNPKIKVSTILGGVGLAISTHCKHEDLALAYVYYVANAKTQTGIYTEIGGQPGNLVAWLSETNNQLCNNFFKNTLETMNKAYLRPRHVGWNQFQEQGADLLHNGLIKNKSSHILIKKLNKLYQSIVQYE